MPLSPSEQRCIRLVGEYLRQMRGGTWRPEEPVPLEDRVRNEAVPEERMTNGPETAAVEVKGIHGDSEFIGYLSDLASVSRSLAPPQGGQYRLDPFIDFRLPISRRLHKWLKAEIACAAEGLQPGGAAPVRIPRAAQVRLIHSDGPGYISCAHTVTGGEVRRLSQYLVGAYVLEDDRQWEHAWLWRGFRAAMAG